MSIEAAPRFCMECGAPLPEAAKFCPGCGTRVAEPAEPVSTTPTVPPPEEAVPEVPAELREKFERARGELRGDRREVVVLFADVSGFTAMSEAMDPEELSFLMQGVLKELAGVVYRYEGYVDKFIGDAVMALFGAPLAHENDPERAALAALEMLEVAQRHRGMGEPLALHIGLHLGEVVAAHMGSEMRLHYTVMGDTVNVASRLQGAAESNQVLISRAVFERVAARFETEELDPLELKGKAKPVRAYRAIRYAPLRPTAARPTTPFVGRESELGEILQLFARVVEGRGPALVLEAEAGAGKSRLLHEAFHRCGGGLAEAIVQFSQIPLPGRIPPAALIFRQLMTPRDAVTAIDPDEVISRAMQLLGDRGLEHGAGIRLLARRLGSRADAQETTTDPEVARQNQLAALAVVLEVLSMSEPIVLVFEDIHWADETERETLQFLLRALEDKRVGGLLTTRPGGGEGWIGPEVQRLRLAGLSPAHAKAMLGDLFVKLQPDVQRQLLHQSHGNPLFLEELARTIRESPDPSTAVTSIPGSLQGLIRERIDRLEGAPRSLLQMASVLGERFPPGLLARMYRLEAQPMSFEEALDRLQEGGFVDGDRGNEHYVFHHSLVQEVTYAGLLMNVRRVLHESAARLGEEHYADEVEAKSAFFAHHYWEANLPEAAAPHLWRAGRTAAENYELPAAERLLGLLAGVVAEHPEVLADREEKASLAETYGSVLLQRGRLEEADEWFRRLETLAQDAGRVEWMGQALQQRGWVSLYRGALDDAEALYSTALLRLGSGEDRLRANIHNSLGVVHFYRGDRQQALEHYSTALQLRERLEDKFGMAKSYSNIGMLQIHMEEDLAGAEQSLRRALALAREVRDHPTTCNVLVNLGRLASEQGAYRRALVRYRQAQRLAEEIGRPFIRFLSLRNQAHCYVQLGRLDRALPCLDLCLQQGDEILAPGNRVAIRLLYFEAYLRAAADDRAEAMLREAEDLADQLGLEEVRDDVLLGKGRLLSARGQWKLAAQAFSAATKVSKEFQSPANLRLGRALHYRAQKRAGLEEAPSKWPLESGEGGSLGALLAYLKADAEAVAQPSVDVARTLDEAGRLASTLGEVALERAAFERQAEVLGTLGDEAGREEALSRAANAMLKFEQYLPEDLKDVFASHPRNALLYGVPVRA